MKFNILKYYYKLFDNKKYRRLKKQNITQRSVELFENKYRDYLYGIENKIKNSKKITFIPSIKSLFLKVESFNGKRCFDLFISLILKALLTSDNKLIF